MPNAELCRFAVLTRWDWHAGGGRKLRCEADHPLAWLTESLDGNFPFFTAT
ncbi:hypothetical protein D9M68_407820 [compost metagenome]|jgi:hypothetical protein